MRGVIVGRKKARNKLANILRLLRAMRAALPGYPGMAVSLCPVEIALNASELAVELIGLLPIGIGVRP